MKTITTPADIPDRHPVDEGPLADALAIEHAAAVAVEPDLEPQPEDDEPVVEDGKKATPFQCYDWNEAFDLCRELNRPVFCLVGGAVSKCFPSGRGEDVVDFHTPAEPEDDGPETLAHLVGALAHLLDVPTEDIFDILETGPTSTERVRHNPGGGR